METIDGFLNDFGRRGDGHAGERRARRDGCPRHRPGKCRPGAGVAATRHWFGSRPAGCRATEPPWSTQPRTLWCADVVSCQMQPPPRFLEQIGDIVGIGDDECVADTGKTKGLDRSVERSPSDAPGRCDRGERRERVVARRQIGVNLVGDHEDAMSSADRRDVGELAGGPDPTDRAVWVTQNQRRCRRTRRLVLQVVEVDAISTPNRRREQPRSVRSGPSPLRMFSGCLYVRIVPKIRLAGVAGSPLWRASDHGTLR